MKIFLRIVIFLIIIVAILIIASQVDLEQYETFFTTILGVATFIFGIFIGFSISDRRDRIDKIRENDSSERSKLVAMCLFADQMGKDFGKKVRQKVDEYLMATLDYTIWDYHKTQEQYENLFNVVSGFNPKNDRQIVLYQQILDNLDDIIESRKITISLISDRLSAFEWWTFIFLSIVIIISLVAINSGTIISILIILFLSISLILLLSFLFSLDDLSWKEEERIFEPYAKTFEAAKLVRYYPEALIIKHRVKNMTDEYRMGIFPNKYPDLSGKKIKLVKK